jgi:hypothetical protein
MHDDAWLHKDVDRQQRKGVGSNPQKSPRAIHTHTTTGSGPRVMTGEMVANAMAAYRCRKQPDRGATK